MGEQTALKAQHKEFGQLNVFVYDKTFRIFAKGQSEIHAYSLVSFHNFKIVKDGNGTDLYINDQLVCSLPDFRQIAEFATYLQELLEHAADYRGRNQALIVDKLFGVDTSNDT